MPPQGFLLTIAPRFHVVPNWGERLRINSGLEMIENRWLPKEDWRPLNPLELAALLGEQKNTRLISLLPEREPLIAHTGELNSNALSLLAIPQRLRAAWWELAGQQEEGQTQFDLGPFVQQLVEFCQFKQLPLPVSCTFDVLISAPGERLIQMEQTPRLTINLGDEATYLLIQSEMQLADEPVLRLTLAPAEGAWLPQGGWAVAGSTVDKTDLDVMLVVR